MVKRLKDAGFAVGGMRGLGQRGGCDFEGDKGAGCIYGAGFEDEGEGAGAVVCRVRVWANARGSCV